MMLSTIYRRKITEKGVIQVIILLATYACYRTLALQVFFNGFLKTFPGLNKAIFSPGNIPAWLSRLPYHSPSIILSALLNPWFVIALSLFYIPLFNKRRILYERTVVFDKGSRIIIFAAALVLAWELSTYDYNYYLGHAFYFDRIVLVSLAILLLRYPLLSPLFLAFACVYRSQFSYPIAGFPLYDIRVLFDVQALFFAYALAVLYLPSLRFPFIYFVLCMVGANYFMTGFSKLMLQPHLYGWLVKNDVGYLLANVHYRGWLVNVSDYSALTIAATVSKYRFVLQGIVLLIELSGLFLLRSRKFAIIFLVGFCTMHLGIFLLSGILFWKWAAVDGTLMLLLICKHKYVREELFTKQAFIASVTIIGTSYLWQNPLMIGWYDTPLCQYFTYEVTTDDGKIYELAKYEMSPYHQWLEYDYFPFMVNQPLLRIAGSGGWTTSYDVFSAVKRCGPEQFKLLEAHSGKNLYDSVTRARYHSFIKAYFGNRNKRLEGHFLPYYLHAPYHMYSFTKTRGYNNNCGEVRNFRVIFNQTYTQNYKKVVLYRQVVDDIPITNFSNFDNTAN